jgi:hypothetical protein
MVCSKSAWYDLKNSWKQRSVPFILLRLITDKRARARLVYSSSRVSNEERNDLYSPPNIIRVIKSGRMSWTGHVAHFGERRVIYRVLVGKPEGKRPLGKPRCR